MKATTAITLAVTATLTGTAGAGAGAVVAEPSGAEESHCIVNVVGVEETGELVTDDPDCYPTLQQSLAAAGVPRAHQRSFDTSELAVGDLVTASGAAIGVHWEGANRTGSSITITGTDCAGGYVNLSSAWTNRISSTLNICPSIRFFDGFDKSGDVEVTSSSTVNLGALNNRANSVSYGA